MKRLPLLTGLAAAATVAMSLAASAAPTASITAVSGVWGPVTGGENKVFYDLDSEVRWGGSNDTRDQKSGYRFASPDNLPVEGILAEDLFSLGMFTHFNNPIPAGT